MSNSQAQHVELKQQPEPSAPPAPEVVILPADITTTPQPDEDFYNIREVSVRYGGKMNLGDYNSVDIAISATAVVEPGQSMDQVVDYVLASLKKTVQGEAQRLATKRNARIDQVFAGLPAEGKSSLQ